jgi:C_GCAxxG_C_C family probable redox protein
MERSSVPRIATGFGAGMGRTGDVCGAIAGAIIAIGLKHGRDTAEEDREVAYSHTRALMATFEQEFRSVRCRDLIGVDLRTPEGQEELHRRNIHAELCTRFVAFAAVEAFSLLGE